MSLETLASTSWITVLAYGLLASVFIVFPLYNAVVTRRYRRREPHLAEARKAAERLADYRQVILVLWTATALVAFLLVRGDFTAAELFLLPSFAPLPLLVTALSVLGSGMLFFQARAYAAGAEGSAERCAETRQQLSHLEAVVPRSRRELRWFTAVSFSAGFCEEVLYRGFLLAVLTPSLGFWAAALVSTVAFGYAHLYQGGLLGCVRTALVGAALMAVVYFAGSIWPAVLLHVIIDLTGGYIGYRCLQDGEAGGAPGELATAAAT